jgi:hypothetical protein
MLSIWAGVGPMWRRVNAAGAAEMDEESAGTKFLLSAAR